MSERSARKKRRNQAHASMPHRSPVSSHCVFLDTASLVWLEEGMPDCKRKNARGFRSSKGVLLRKQWPSCFRQLAGGAEDVPAQRLSLDNTQTSATWRTGFVPRHWRGHGPRHCGFSLPCVCVGSTPEPRFRSESSARRTGAEHCATRLLMR